MSKSVLIYLLLSGILLFNSCSEKKTEEKKEEKKESSVIIKKATYDDRPNMLADISISGMVDELTCVEPLKELLLAMVGVTEIEIDFNSENEINHAKVKFDNSKIDDKEMVNAIEKLKDGTYKVESVELKKLNENTAVTKKKIEDAEVSATETFSSESGSGGFALPGILDVFDVL